METTIYRIGAGTVDITPPLGVSMPSQGSPDIIAEGAYTPLTARVLTLDDGHEKVAFISAELLYWGDANIEKLRKRLHAELGLEPRQLIFNTTHTHNSPVVNPELSFYEEIIDKTVALIRRCFDKAREGQLWFGRGRSTLGVNRRRKDPQGYVYWGVNRYGPIDEELLVLKAVDRQGQTIAIVFNHAIHPTTIRCPLYGGDLIGYAMESLEQRNPGAVAIFLQGTAGEIKIHHHRKDDPSRFTFEGDLEQVKQYGVQLADHVADVLGNSLEPIKGLLWSKLDIAQLPVLNEHVDDDGADPFRGPTRRMARLAKRMLESMDEHGNYKQTKPCEVHLLRIGDDFIFVGMNGEICVNIGLRIKNQLSSHQAMVCGYTNLNAGYIPSMDMIPEKGDEAQRIPYSLELEDILIGKVMEVSAEGGPIPRSITAR